MGVKSNENSVFTLGTLVAAADLSGKQYCTVKVDSDGKIALCTATTDLAIGILRNKPVAGEVAEVIVQGVALCKTGGAITAGTYVMPTATTGVVTTHSSTNTKVGIALQEATASGDIISVLLTK